MLGSFGWTERPFSKSNLRFCPAKRSQHALRLPYGPIPPVVLLPANYFEETDSNDLRNYLTVYITDTAVWNKGHESVEIVICGFLIPRENSKYTHSIN